MTGYDIRAVCGEVEMWKHACRSRNAGYGKTVILELVEEDVVMLPTYLIGPPKASD